MSWFISSLVIPIAIGSPLVPVAWLPVWWGADPLANGRRDGLV
ncbi:hypothetical protein [uncultured Mucilaginibacter sp.]|nr:hypothetical protein [uncultured Mucilaginibacter sp.]